MLEHNFNDPGAPNYLDTQNKIRKAEQQQSDLINVNTAILARIAANASFVQLEDFSFDGATAANNKFIYNQTETTIELYVSGLFSGCPIVVYKIINSTGGNRFVVCNGKTFQISKVPGEISTLIVQLIEGNRYDYLGINLVSATLPVVVQQLAPLSLVTNSPKPFKLAFKADFAVVYDWYILPLGATTVIAIKNAPASINYKPEASKPFTAYCIATSETGGQLRSDSVSCDYQDYEAPFFITFPVAFEVDALATTTLTAQVGGVETPGIKWYYNPGGATDIEAEGWLYISNTTTINFVFPDSCTLYAAITNKDGDAVNTVNSQVIAVTVNKLPQDAPVLGSITVNGDVISIPFNLMPGIEYEATEDAVAEEPVLLPVTVSPFLLTASSGSYTPGKLGIRKKGTATHAPSDFATNTVLVELQVTTPVTAVLENHDFTAVSNSYTAAGSGQGPNAYAAFGLTLTTGMTVWAKVSQVGTGSDIGTGVICALSSTTAQSGLANIPFGIYVYNSIINTLTASAQVVTGVAASDNQFWGFKVTDTQIIPVTSVDEVMFVQHTDYAFTKVGGTTYNLGGWAFAAGYKISNLKQRS